MPSLIWPQATPVSLPVNLLLLSQSLDLTWDNLVTMEHTVGAITGE